MASSDPAGAPWQSGGGLACEHGPGAARGRELIGRQKLHQGREIASGSGAELPEVVDRELEGGRRGSPRGRERRVRGIRGEPQPGLSARFKAWNHTRHIRCIRIQTARADQARKRALRGLRIGLIHTGGYHLSGDLRVRPCPRLGQVGKLLAGRNWIANVEHERKSGSPSGHRDAGGLAHHHQAQPGANAVLGVRSNGRKEPREVRPVEFHHRQKVRLEVLCAGGGFGPDHLARVQPGDVARTGQFKGLGNGRVGGNLQRYRNRRGRRKGGGQRLGRKTGQSPANPGEERFAPMFGSGITTLSVR